MKYSHQDLVLTPDAAIDLQLHTVHSDGVWTAESLIDYLKAEQFSLAAITDHDRADIQPALQQVAAEKGFPLLVAVEMSSMWHNKLTDFLCFGFDSDHNVLDTLAQEVTRRQHENTRQVFNHLQHTGYPVQDTDLEAMLAKPAAQQLPSLLDLVTQHHRGEKSIGRTLLDAGFAYCTQPPARIVEVAHQSGAVCILAHPGRDDGFVQYDDGLLDELRAEAPIDGIETYYPLHTPAHTNTYLAYARQHHLLVSSGSDSHGPEKPPIKYRAEAIAELLERLGIHIGSA
jgi:predicted metal-dependent phosphoesterase TrpH